MTRPVLDRPSGSCQSCVVSSVCSAELSSTALVKGPTLPFTLTPESRQEKGAPCSGPGEDPTARLSSGGAQGHRPSGHGGAVSRRGWLSATLRTLCHHHQRCHIMRNAIKGRVDFSASEHVTGKGGGECGPLLPAWRSLSTSA